MHAGIHASDVNVCVQMCVCLCVLSQKCVLLCWLPSFLGTGSLTVPEACCFS